MKTILTILLALSLSGSHKPPVKKPFQSLNQSLDTLAIKSDQLLILTQKLK